MIITTNEIMRDTIDKLLKNANELFLKKKFKDAILLYDEILKLDAENLNVINNKGYALSKIKNYDDAISCYDQGLKINPNEKSLQINKISSLRKKHDFQSALNLCNFLLKNESVENIVLYHKIRILHSMKKFTESIEICNMILELYPNNADVLFDKSCNYALLNDYPNCLKNLKMAINISNKFKINSRENKSFESLRKIKEFQKLIE